MTPFLFLAGAALAYYVAMPLALHFLLGYPGQSRRHPAGGAARRSAIISSFVMHFIFGFGVAFLLPVLLMLLERAGLVTREQLKSGRRYAIVVAFVDRGGADPARRDLAAAARVPLVLLYEFSLIAIWFTERSGRGRRRPRPSHKKRAPAKGASVL